MTRPPLGLLAVAAVLLLGTGVGSAVRGTGTTAKHTSTSVEVVGSTVVCPDLRQTKDLLATRASVGSGPLPPGRSSAGGAVEARKISAPGSSIPVPVRSSGQVAIGLGTTTNKDGLVVAATGDLSAALEVEQITRGEAGLDRGLAGLRCEPPSADIWFEGGSTMLGNESVLVLANVDDTPATLDIDIYSSKGPVDARGGQGLVIPPHFRDVVQLDTLAPDRDLLAVHVKSSRGRVAAGLRHGLKTVLVTEGIDWVPQTAPPAKEVVVPGFPEGPGLRALYVTNPGNDDATVSVKVTTKDAQFVPVGRDAISVPAGTTVPVRLDSQTTESAVAATVTSDGVPIIAGGFVKDFQAGSKVREFAYTAGALPLSGPALLTDVVIDRPTESTLVLTAPDAAATVVVTPVQVLGQTGALPAAKTVKVEGGRTSALKLSTFFPPGTEARLAVEVRPVSGSGPVYAARYLREHGAHGPLTTLLVLAGPAQLVSRPAVYTDPQAATP